MTYPLPEGENLRDAVRWIAEERKKQQAPNLVAIVDAACIRFDLSPGDGEFLLRFVRESDR